MFKKFVCMTALSLTLASSPEASASGKCIVSGCSPYNSSALMCNNISKCNNVSSLNFTKNYSIAEYNPTRNKFLLAMSILDSVFCNLYCAFRDTILEKCNSSEFVKYIKYRSNNKTRDEITRCTLEKYLSNKWILISTSLLATLSLIGDYYSAGIFLIPSTVFGNLRFITDVCYTISYILPNVYYCKCMNDFLYAKCLFDQNLIRSIPENDISSERKFLFGSLIKRGHIVKLCIYVGIENIIRVVGNSNIKKEHILALYNDGKMSAEELYSNGKGISIEKLRDAGIECNPIENKNNESNCIIININNV